MLKHPRAGSARMNNFPAGTEDNVGTGTALVPATVAARATVELVLDERQQTTRTVDWLEPLADDAVKAYLARQARRSGHRGAAEGGLGRPPGAGPGERARSSSWRARRSSCAAPPRRRART